MKRQGRMARLRTLMDDPDKISSMKDKVDKALILFHVRTHFVFVSVFCNEK